jgi:hypothetical protein
MKFFCDEYVPLKRKGARMRIRRKSWLKQLRVAVSTRASVPSESSPQNLQTNFVDWLHSICNFKTRENFSKVHIIKVSLTCLEIFMQNGKMGKGDVFSQENVFIVLFASKS